MISLYLDLETRWDLNLDDHGSVRCAADPSAGINCAAFAFDDSPIEVFDWYQSQRERLSEYLLRLISQADRIVAHSALFEIFCLRYILGIEVDITKWYCTMAKAAYHGYPRGLDDAAKAVGCKALKDIGGKGVMKKLVSGKWTPETAPDDFNRLYSYCAADIPPMRELDQRLPELPPDVRAQWLLDAEINLRGVPIDLTAIQNGVDFVQRLAIKNDSMMSVLTGGQVEKVTQVARILTYLKNSWALELPDCTADTIVRALQEDLPDRVLRVLTLRQDAGLSSLAKYHKMLDYQVDGRLYDMFSFYGAHTGRATGYGPQVMNLPRGDDPIGTAQTLFEAPWLIFNGPKPDEKLKEGIRGTICAPGDKTFVGMDLSQIECRVTFWIAGENMAIFHTSDPYCTYGKKLFGREINKKDDPEERNAAKAAVLAFGFVGGIGAGQRIGDNYNFNFNTMADILLPSASQHELVKAQENYAYYLGKHPAKPLTEREAFAVDILKQRYRVDFSRISDYWYKLEDAFLLGGTAGLISVKRHPSGLRVLTLPSGRQLFYHGVKREKRGVIVDGCDEETEGFSYSGRRGRKFFWRGTLIENVAQAINEDITGWYKIRANKMIGPVVHHCYDEFTMECLEKDAAVVLAQLKELTATQPDWCSDLPLGFDYWVSKRYGK